MKITIRDALGHPIACYGAADMKVEFETDDGTRAIIDLRENDDGKRLASKLHLSADQTSYVARNGESN
jgi:hypothetical protein